MKNSAVLISLAINGTDPFKINLRLNFSFSANSPLKEKFKKILKKF